MKYLKTLSWDSEFFGLKVATVRDSCSPDELGSEAFETECREEGVNLLYYSREVSACAQVHDLVSKGFRMVDLQASLAINLDGLAESDKAPLMVGKTTEGLSVERLHVIAGEISRHSRFFRDERISGSKVVGLYELWVDNALNGTFGDFVFISGTAPEPQGFVVYKKLEPTMVDLSLIGLDPKVQGSGQGARLVKGSLTFLRGKGFGRCQVKVSLTNGKALAFYERLGFVVDSIRFIFHKHMTGA